MIKWLIGKIFGTRNERYLKSLRPKLRKCNALEPEMQALEDAQLAERLAECRRQIQEEGRTLDDAPSGMVRSRPPVRGSRSVVS